MSPLKALVTIDHNHAITTSLMVADKFDKHHKNVLRNIEFILQKCPDKEFGRLNFEPSSYLNEQNKTQPMYKMTRDGFALLVRGFTGEKAFLWNIAFINTFNQMEAKLNELLVTEHQALIESLFKRHPQWRETVEATQGGMATGELARLQGKSKSATRAMKARIRAAGIDCRPASPAQLLH